jgi:hypothetical protein
MFTFRSTPERPPTTSVPSALWQTRLSRLRNRAGRTNVQKHTARYRCIVDHLPPEMSEATFRDFIGVAADVPITWFPGDPYAWCLVSVTEAEALAMEQRLDGLELDDQHTLRCEAMGAGESLYASSWLYQMPGA